MSHHSKDHQLLSEAYDNQQFWEQLNTYPLKGKRKLGSVEWVGNATTLDDATAKRVVQLLQGKGYKIQIIPTPEGHTVAFYKELTLEVSKALQLYTTYESMPQDKDGTTIQGLTKEQHIYLGQIFGLTKPEIKDFIENAGFEG